MKVELLRAGLTPTWLAAHHIQPLYRNDIRMRAFSSLNLNPLFELEQDDQGKLSPNVVTRRNFAFEGFSLRS